MGTGSVPLRLILELEHSNSSRRKSLAINRVDSGIDMSIKEDKDKLSKVSSNPEPARLDDIGKQESKPVFVGLDFSADPVTGPVFGRDELAPATGVETLVLKLDAVVSMADTGFTVEVDSAVVTVVPMVVTAGVTGVADIITSKSAADTGMAVTGVKFSVDTGTTLSPVATTGGMVMSVAIVAVCSIDSSIFGSKGSIRGIMTRCFHAGRLPIRRFPLGKSKKGFGTLTLAEPSSFVLRSSVLGFIKIGTSAGRRNLVSCVVAGILGGAVVVTLGFRLTGIKGIAGSVGGASPVNMIGSLSSTAVVVVASCAKGAV